MHATWKHVGPMPNATSHHDFPRSDIRSEVCVHVWQRPNKWSGLKNFGHHFFHLECIQITQKVALEQMHVHMH